MKKNRNKMLESVSYVVFLNLILVGGLLFLLYDINEKRSEIGSLWDQLALYEKRIESVNELERVLSDTSSQQDKIKSVFLDKESIVNFIEELEYLSENGNLILDMKGVSMSDNENFAGEKPSFVFSVSGAFADVYKYIVLLENNKYRVSFEKMFMQKTEENGVWKANVELQLVSYKDESR